MRLFRSLDQRIVAELRTQKRTIWKGLLCVGLTSLLTAAMVPMTKLAIQSIEEAAPVRVDISAQVPFEKDLSDELGVSVERVREALNKLRPMPAAADLAREIGVTTESAQVAIDHVKARGKTLETQAQIGRRQDDALVKLGVLCLGVVFIFGAKYFFTRGQFFYLSKASAALASDLRVRLFNKLQRLPISYFNDKRVGGIQSVLTNDINVYQNAVSVIRDSIDGPTKGILALASIIWINWQLAVVAMLFIPVMAWFVNRNGRRMKAAQAQVQEDLADLSAMSQEALNGTRIVKAFGAEDRVGGLFKKLVDRQYESQLRANRRFAQLRPMVEFIGAVSLAAILYICGHLARAGALRISDIIALTFALDIINQGARSLANVNNTYNQVQAAADRIYAEVLAVPEESQVDDGLTLTSPQGRIEFKDVSFSYPDGTKALENVSFVIEPGTSLALVGPSGAGKSTIADLVLRFYDPTEGHVLFDGKDIRKLKTSWYRSQFGVVPQQTFLFAGSIAENLRLGMPDASDQDLEKAAKMAHAEAFIESTSEGYRTELGERGVRLSGGEGQRLAIARALVRNPLVLLLDEATSNLDAHSEKAVTEALTELMQQKTTLFIAHRLTTAARADRILVLRRGQIVEEGSHASLMGSKGTYAAMYEAFSSGLLGEEGLG
ncbi:MAG: ABC transporter ATP-binding protein [Armatimonadetes bacterium]|nr:ABC transporter ATP-binding protein [Armatimonadota bacterium]